MTSRSMADAVRASERQPSRTMRRLALAVAHQVGAIGKPVWPYRVRERIKRLPMVSRARIHGDSVRTPDSRRSVVFTNDLSESGAPRLACDIALRLRKRGDEVIVLSPKDGALRASLLDKGIAVVVDPAIEEGSAPLLEVIAGLAEVGLCNTIVGAGTVGVLADRVPLIWFIHEISLLEHMLAHDPALARLLQKVTLLWGGSELPAAILRRHRPDVQVVAYGTEPIGDAPPAGSRAGEPLRIGIFGSYEPRKGQDLALEAVLLLDAEQRRGMHLVMHGRVLFDDFFAALEARATGVPEVEPGPPLDHRAVNEAMRACDAVLMPSRDDTLPMVTADALSCGRVVICTSTTGTAALLNPGVDGFVATAPTGEAIAAALSDALARRADWPAIGEAGRAVYDRVFSSASFDRRLEESFSYLEANRPR